jgi:predicted dienelactone hydrolase
MARYQVCYTKGNAPLTAWRQNESDAHLLAESLRKSGYTVQVWAHTGTGAKMTKL